MYYIIILIIYIARIIENSKRDIMTNREITHNITVLYAEDETLIQEGITESLNLFNINVICAKNGKEALEIFQNSSEKIDLILTDIKMPQLDGIAMIQKIREFNKEIPIIITSAHQERDFLMQAIELNISSYVLKPIDIYKLENTILKAMEPTLLKKELLEKNKKLEIEIQKHKETQELMQVQSRFAAMGEMIAMIAHQWRQPLAAIGTATFNLKHKLLYAKFDLETQEGRENQTKFFCQKFEDIELYLQNLTSTIDDFRNFFRSDKTIIQTKIENTINNSLNMIQKDLESHKIELILDFQTQQKISIYENEMIHVFLNIIKNAQDKLLEKKIENPTITIATKDIEKTIQIDIYDNGGGIETENIDMIFEPYFSTKKDKNGTGIGLYMSKIIVETNHKGKLTAKNIADGACFSIILDHNL